MSRSAQNALAGLLLRIALQVGINVAIQLLGPLFRWIGHQSGITKIRLPAEPDHDVGARPLKSLPPSPVPAVSQD